MNPSFGTRGIAGLIFTGAALLCCSIGFAREDHWAEFTFPRNDGRYLTEVRPERVVTPHMEFAKPLVGGPVKVLFIIPQTTARDAVELWQRMDIDFAAVVLGSGDDVADDFPLTTAVLGQSTPEKERLLDHYLDGKYDVICLAGVMFDKLPEKARFKILRAVQNGTGLFGVLEKARTPEPIFMKLQIPSSAAEVLSGSTLSGLPYFKLDAQNTAVQAMEKLMAPTPACFGKGRIAWLNYSAAHDVNSWYAGDCFGRPASPKMGEVSRPEVCDAAIAISAKALLWTSGRKQAFRIVPGTTDGTIIKRGEWPQEFTAKLIRSGSDSSQITLEALLIRPDGSFKTETSVKLTAKENETPVSFKLAPAPHGQAFLWCIIKNDKGEIYDWSVSTINIEAPASFKDLKADPEVVACNSETMIAGRIEGSIPAGAKVLAEARDSYGRLFWREEKEANASISFKLSMAGACGRNVMLEIKLLSGSETVALENVEIFLNRPLGHEFLNLIWGHPGLGVCDWQARGALNDLQGRQLEKAGFNAGMVFQQGQTLDQTLNYLTASAKALTRTDTRWMFYCAHVQMAQLRSRFNPEERKKEEARLTAFGERARSYGPYIYNLGDENGLYGQAPEDLNNFELAAYRDFLKRSYNKDIKSLNKTWNSNYSSFDKIEVNPAGKAEVPIPRKYDLKVFWEWSYADCYHWMRDALRKGDPNAQVGAEGSVGEDLELTISKLDWWAPYENRLENAILRFWKPWSSCRGNWWGAYSAGPSRMCGRNVDVLWQGLATGSVNSSMFFVSGANSEGMMAVDGGYADYFESWIPKMREICENVGPLVRASIPIDDGVGIYYSQLSNHASLFDPRFADTKKTQELMVEYFDALGVNVKFISDRKIMEGKLDAKSTPLLMMCVTKAIPDKIPAALEAYVKSGGILIADVVPDLRGEHLVETAPGRLLSLFGAKAEGATKQAELEIAFKDSDIAGKKLSLTAGKCMVDTTLKLAGGTAAGKAGETPIMIWRKNGAGLAILLNFDLYHAVPTVKMENPASTASGDFLLELMGIAGLKPEFQPAKGLTWGTVRRFRHADATVLGLDTWRGAKGEMRFSANKKMRIHPLRQDWGGDAEGELVLPKGVTDSGLIAVLPEGERSISFDLPKSVTPGEIVPVKVKLLKNGKKIEGSLIRFDVLNPDGSCVQAHQSFMPTGEDGTAAFTWAVEVDAKGAYKLKAVELVSGTATTANIEIK